MKLTTTQINDALSDMDSGTILTPGVVKSMVQFRYGAVDAFFTLPGGATFNVYVNDSGWLEITCPRSGRMIMIGKDAEIRVAKDAADTHYNTVLDGEKV